MVYHYNIHVCVICTVEKVYTVEEAIEKIGFGFFQVIVTLFSGLLWVRVVVRRRGTPS